MKINKSIVQTLVVRGGTAVANMAIVFLTLNVLGAEARGKISLFLTDLMLITMVMNVMGSSTISYHVPKTNLKPLVKYGALWILMISIVTAFGLNLFHEEYLQKHLFPIAILLGGTTMNQMILIGKQKMTAYNIVFVLDPFVKLIVLLIGFYGLKSVSLDVFLIAMYISLSISLLVSSLYVFKTIKNDEREVEIEIRKVLKYGLGTEVSSVIQFFNYRLLFYVVYYQLGSVELGWFSVAVSITESVWIISRSITVNQYSQILNIAEKIQQRMVTNKSAVLSFSLTLIGVVLLVSIPDNWLGFIIKKDTHRIQEIVKFLCPGILIIAVSNVWGHYFSGRGRYQINNLKSLLGFLMMISSAYLLIPMYGLFGVVWSMLLGYVFSSATLLFFYVKDKN